jgi:hypothetical protein
MVSALKGAKQMLSKIQDEPHWQWANNNQNGESLTMFASSFVIVEIAAINKCAPRKCST